MKTRLEYLKEEKKILKEADEILERFAYLTKYEPNFIISEAPKKPQQKIAKVISSLKKNVTKKPLVPVLPKPATDTGVKEGLVMYFATQNVKDIDEAIAKVVEKKDTRLKFDTKTITNNKDKYDGNPIAGDKTAQAIEYLNTRPITDPMLKKMFLNGLSSGKYLSKTISGGKGINPQNIDRGNEIFGGIKSQAVKLVQDVGVRLSSGESDKWCPADIFVYGSGVSISKIESTTTLNVDKNSLNSLFIETFTMPQSGKILGVSLKEEKAQAGKATSFLSVLDRNKNYPEVKVDDTQSKFTALAYLFKVIRAQKDIGYVSEAIGILQKNEESIKKIVKNQIDVLKSALIKQLKTSLASTSDTKKVKLKDNQLTIIQNKNGIFDKTLTRNYVKQAKLEKEFTIISELETAITSFNATILAYAKKQYNAARADFKKVLTASNFNEPIEKNKLDTSNSELLLKKAGCYEIASKVLNGVKDGKKLNIPPAFKNIILEKQNVFLAVTAYAISQGGISPTFFKLIGSESGGEAHVKPFYGDGILSLEKGTDVEIVDSGGFAGFEAQFKTQILKGTELIDKYKVTLGFQYAGDQFKIEVTELK